MLSQKQVVASLAFVLLSVPASAGPLVYVVSDSFGTIDLSTGAFTRIGPGAPEQSDGLSPAANGRFYSLGFGGNLDSIDPATGIASVIGVTGLDTCILPSDSCGPNSANNLVSFGGTLYATDLSNNLYTVDPATGKATLKGPTGIPPLPYHLLATNSDGSTNTFDETLFTAGGKLFATFDAHQINFATFTFNTVVAPALYQINPVTGIATRIAHTANTLSATVNVNGAVYAFNAQLGQVVTLDLTNGHTSFVSNLDPAAGLIGGAAFVTPEPASQALAGFGLLAMLAFLRRSVRRV